MNIIKMTHKKKKSKVTNIEKCESVGPFHDKVHHSIKCNS